MWWVPWFLLKYPQMCVALRIPKAVLAMGFTRTTPSHWSMATVLFRKKRRAGDDEILVPGDYGDTQSTEEQLNCSVLWEVKVTCGIWKYMQAQEACLIGSPGFFWPFQLKWRQERGRGMPVLFVPSAWWERKGIKYSQRWASNGPKTIS